jgi:predicted DNA-binding transcriptional regulator YafY
MSQIERVYSIDQLLRRRLPPGRAELLRRLAVSPATLKRDLVFMKDRLHAPIVWDRVRRGYRYDETGGGPTKFQIPGLWFSRDEISGLLLVRELLSQIQPGYLADQLEPLERRIKELSEASRFGREHIVLRAVPVRPANPEFFERVAAAADRRLRLGITYFGRHRNEESVRIISPRSLICYRGAWYVDAWCDTKNDWRRFALDRIRAVRPMTTPATEREFHPRFDTYGIYAGHVVRTATLHFDAEASRWVADEEWHPRQTRTLLEDGSLILRVPFDNSQELLMDVLRYGKHVVVIEPEDLRQAVISSLEEARAVYDRPDRRPPQSVGSHKTRRAKAL